MLRQVSDITLAGGDLLEGTAPELVRAWGEASDAAREAGGRRGLQITWQLVYPRGGRQSPGDSAGDEIGAAVLDAISSFVERQRAAWANKNSGACGHAHDNQQLRHVSMCTIR